MEKLKAEKKYNLIGTYWEKQNKNEIDIVALNDLDKVVIFAEVKRNAEKIDLNILKEKTKTLSIELKKYTQHFIGYSLGDM